ncbi:Haloacid dehalogenase-like hydrolase [Beggiatoa sp. PS]|nr:Haloacid dehalogenase-like hydrolase [Beggiatoa sp. PS]
MIKVIILDLDGPLLDGRFRHYQCYKDILEKRGYTPMPREKYWEMKRNRQDRKQLLAVTGAEAIYDCFLTEWLDRIESMEMLALDKIQPSAITKLQEWRNSGILILLATMRQHPKRLHKQLHDLGIKSFMDQIVVCDYRKGGIGKALAVKDVVPDLSPKCSLWVGDTEVDFKAAKFLGCPVWLIYQGIRSKAYLASLQTYFLSESIADIDIQKLQLPLYRC